MQSANLVNFFWSDELCIIGAWYPSASKWILTPTKHNIHLRMIIWEERRVCVLGGDRGAATYEINRVFLFQKFQYPSSLSEQDFKIPSAQIRTDQWCVVDTDPRFFSHPPTKTLRGFRKLRSRGFRGKMFVCLYDRSLCHHPQRHPTHTQITDIIYMTVHI